MDRFEQSPHRSALSGVRRMDKISNQKRNRVGSKKNVNTEWDYKTLDQKIKFAYKQDRIEEARRLGYNHLTQAFVELYRKHKSSYKVGRILKVTPASVLHILKRIGEPTVSRGCYPRKGRN